MMCDYNIGKYRKILCDVLSGRENNFRKQLGLLLFFMS